MLVTFLSDFGTADVFVGLCHAAVARHAPSARIVDLSHTVPPQDAVTGAWRLRNCMAYLPPAVHLAVVDPGVGTARRAVIVRAGAPHEPSWFVGPDNGLLLPAARQVGGTLASWNIPVAGDSTSPTFHGRDVFAPAAGRLAAGTDPATLGTPIDPHRLIDVPDPGPTTAGTTLVTTVRDVDTFGNVQLSAQLADLDTAAPGGVAKLAAPGDAVSDRVELTVVGTASATTPGPRVVHGRLVSTFGDLHQGELGLLVDSFGWLAIVVALGDAAERLSVSRHDEVRLAMAGEPSTDTKTDPSPESQEN